MCPLTKLYVATVMHQHNMRILHWKVVGEGFDAAHKLFEDMTNTLGEHIDAIAEVLIMGGFNPLTLQQVISCAQGEDFSILELDPCINYDSEDAYRALQCIFTHLLCLYEEAKESDMVPQNVKDGMIQKHYEFLSLEAKYKNIARMK